MRLGTERANKLLLEIATGLGLELMLGACGSRRLVAARRAFAIQGRALGISVTTLAAALGVHRCTIMAYGDPQLRQRRNLHQRRVRAMAREARCFPSEGRINQRQSSGWNVPEYHWQLRHYATAQVCIEGTA